MAREQLSGSEEQGSPGQSSVPPALALAGSGVWGRAQKRGVTGSISMVQSLSLAPGRETRVALCSITRRGLLSVDGCFCGLYPFELQACTSPGSEYHSFVLS